MVRSTLPMTGRPRGLVLLILVMLLGSLAWAPVVSAASTLYVAQLPTAIGDGSSCASPGYNDIQAAVQDAVAGDTVHICAGTYALPSFIFIQVDLTLRGDSAATTIIDGSDTRPLFSGAMGKTISFVNLTLQNGRAFVGGDESGGAINGATTVNVTNSVFKDNDAVGFAGSGGAIKATTVTVTNSTFTGNTAPGSGGAIQAVSITVSASTFSGNVATTFDGGAIFGTTVNVTDSTFTANDATNAGGAILGVTTTVVDSSFTANTTSLAGGAIAGSTLTATDSTFHANTAGSVGGAVVGTTATVLTSTFTGNTAAVDGGAIRASNTATVTNSTFSANSASNAGGAIDAGTATVANSTFSANSATFDGGAIDAGTATVANSTFSANSATFGGGGAILAASLTATNSTFSANSAASGGGAVYVMNTANVTNGTFSANSVTFGGGGAIAATFANVTNTVLAQPTATNNCLGGVTDGGGNLSTDASCGFSQPTSQVVTPAALALGSLAANGGPTQTIALGAASVARDSGIDAVCAATPVNGLDQRGTSRPQGAHCDSGAYEYVSPAPPPEPPPAPVPTPAPVPPVMTDSIAPGVNRGSSGFGTSSVILPTQGYVTFLVRLDPTLAGQTVELWTRTKTGAWLLTTSRLVATDGTVHYYRRINAWTGFWAKLAGGASHGRIGTVR
jgi:predicted outer membrane repeat protein